MSETITPQPEELETSHATEAAEQEEPQISLQDEYLQVVKELEGDAEGFASADEHLRFSYAQRQRGALKWAMNPIVLSEEQYELLERAATTMGSIMEKIMAKYHRDRSFRALFGLPKAVEDLTMVPSGCHAAVPLSRIDVFFDPTTNDFQVCDIVTGSVDGMAPSAEVNRALHRTNAYREFSERYPHVRSIDPVRECVLSLMHTYGKWANAEEGRNHPTHPSLAVVDIPNSPRAAETSTVIDVLHDLGCYARATEFSDLRIEEVGGVQQLVDSQGPITCVWLRARAEEALEAGKGMQVLADATRHGLVCTVGGYRSWPCCTRAFMQILRTNQEARALLTYHERAFVDAHVPMTYVIEPSTDLSMFYDQENWIIKMVDGFPALSLASGSKMSKFEWRNRLIKGIKRHDAVQERLPRHRMTVCAVDENGQPFEECKNIMLGLYVFESAMGGIRATCGTGTTVADWDIVEMGCLTVED